MMLRRGGISLGVVALVVGMGGCVGGKVFGIFGPDKKDDEKGRFGVGSSGSFVTTGGASQDTPDDITFIVDAFTQRMSFNAKGGATPTGVFNFTGQILGTQTHIHGDILCYTIDPITHQARIAGHITSSDPPQDIDNDAVWIVEDNGEGSLLAKDRISLYQSFAHVDGDFHCRVTANSLETTMYPIETGNVQIHE